MVKLYVPDGNWVLHRAMSTLKTNRAIEEALPYSFVSMIIKDALIVNATHIMVAFDGPKVFRYKIFPNYKITRREKKGMADDDYDDGETTPDLYTYLPNLFALFYKIGIPYYQPRLFEADDVLNSIAFRYRDKHTIIGGAQDKDGYQWLSETSFMYDGSYKHKDGKGTGRFIKAKDAEKKRGVLIHQMVDFQTLIGDPGDDIPPIGDIREAKARKILKEYGSIQNWFKQSKKDRVFIRSHLEKMRLNRKLVELSKDALPPGDIDEWKLPKVKTTDPWLTKNFHEYYNWLYPKAKGLFK